MRRAGGFLGKVPQRQKRSSHLLLVLLLPRASILPYPSSELVEACRSLTRDHLRNVNQYVFYHDANGEVAGIELFLVEIATFILFRTELS